MKMHLNPSANNNNNVTFYNNIQIYSLKSQNSLIIQLSSVGIL